MKILVDAMPKEISMCPFSIKSRALEVYFCGCDRALCDFNDENCRWLKLLDKPIKDDCK